VTTMLHRLTLRPPLPLFNFINLKRGGTVPPNENWVGRSHLVPPSYKPTVFMGWDDPTSSHLLRNRQLLWGGMIPPCPTFVQTSSFKVWDDPTSFHLLANHQFLRGGTIPPRPTSPHCRKSCTIERIQSSIAGALASVGRLGYIVAYKKQCTKTKNAWVYCKLLFLTSLHQ
jgi:hypothetical protein